MTAAFVMTCCGGYPDHKPTCKPDAPRPAEPCLCGSHLDTPHLIGDHRPAPEADARRYCPNCGHGGFAPSACACCSAGCRPEADARGPLDLEAYKTAPSGWGAKAYEWKDKPHRLVYDLCNEIAALRAQLAALEKESESYRKSMVDWADRSSANWTRADAAEAALARANETLGRISQRRYHQLDCATGGFDRCACAVITANAALAAKECVVPECLHKGPHGHVSGLGTDAAR